jgi:hypothetical protein
MRPGIMIPVVRGSARMHIDAPVGRFWPLISDVTQIGRFSLLGPRDPD